MLLVLYKIKIYKYILILIYIILKILYIIIYIYNIYNVNYNHHTVTDRYTLRSGGLKRHIRTLNSIEYDTHVDVV